MNQLENSSSTEFIESTDEPIITGLQTAADNLESLQVEIAEIKEVLVDRQQTFPEELSWAGGESIALVDDLDAKIVDMLEALDRGEEVPVSTYEDLERETTRVASVIEVHFHSELYEVVDMMANEVAETLRRKEYNFDHLEYGDGDAADLLLETQLLVNHIGRLRDSYWNTESKYAQFNSVALRVVQFDENISGLDDAMGMLNDDADVAAEESEESEVRENILTQEEHDSFRESLRSINPRSDNYRGQVLNLLVELAQGRDWQGEAETTLNDYMNGREGSYLSLTLNPNDGSIHIFDASNSSEFRTRLFKLEVGGEPTWSPDI